MLDTDAEIDVAMRPFSFSMRLRKNILTPPQHLTRLMRSRAGEDTRRVAAIQRNARVFELYNTFDFY